MDLPKIETLTFSLAFSSSTSSTIPLKEENGPSETSTAEIFSGKKVVLFAVPGAFTPGCSMTHLPGYVSSAGDIKSKGVDTIICMAVNDAFVMDAWGRALAFQVIQIL